MQEQESEYRLKYLQALRIVMTGSVWSLIFSVITLVMGIIMLFGKVGGAIWIVIMMGGSTIISVMLIIKSAKKEHKEQGDLLNG